MIAYIRRRWRIKREFFRIHNWDFSLAQTQRRLTGVGVVGATQIHRPSSAGKRKNDTVAKAIADRFWGLILMAGLLDLLHPGSLYIPLFNFSSLNNWFCPVYVFNWLLMGMFCFVSFFFQSKFRGCCHSFILWSSNIYVWGFGFVLVGDDF